MSSLPEQAVDALVLDHITQALGLVAQHGSVDDHPCGCRWNDMTDRWHLCRYHDGTNGERSPRAEAVTAREADTVKARDGASTKLTAGPFTLGAGTRHDLDVVRSIQHEVKRTIDRHGLVES